MNSALHIRKAQVEDLDGLQNLYTQTINNVCKTDYDEEQLKVWTATIKNRARWIDALTNDFFLVAEINHRPVGFGSLKNGYYLDFLYVDKNHQRLGVAKTIFLALEQEFKRLGKQKLVSDVSKTAKVFFTAQGFTTVKENKNNIDGIEIINYRMEKSLL